MIRAKDFPQTMARDVIEKIISKAKELNDYKVDFSGKIIPEFSHEKIAEAILNEGLIPLGIEDDEDERLINYHKILLIQPKVDNIEQFIEIFMQKYPEKSVCIYEESLKQKSNKLDSNRRRRRIIMIEKYNNRNKTVTVRKYRLQYIQPILFRDFSYDDTDLYERCEVSIVDLYEKIALIYFPEDDNEIALLNILFYENSKGKVNNEITNLNMVYFDDLYDCYSSSDFEIDAILDNPFFYSLIENSLSEWIINNEKIVKRTIRKAFGKMKFFPNSDKDYFNQKVDDCFDYFLYYVSDRNKVFDKDFFFTNNINVVGEDLKLNKEMLSDELKGMENDVEDFSEDSENLNGEDIYYIEDSLDEEEMEYKNSYDIQVFVLSLASKVSLGFYKDISKERNIKRLSNEEKPDNYENNYNKQFEDENKILESNNIGKSDFYLSPDTIADFEYCDNIFNNELDTYDEMFKNVGKNDFKTKEVVYYMFLAGHSTDEEKAKAMGITMVLYNIRMGIFKTVVNGRAYQTKPDFKQILIEKKYLKEENIDKILKEFETWKLEGKVNSILEETELFQKFLLDTNLLTNSKLSKAIHQNDTSTLYYNLFQQIMTLIKGIEKGWTPII